MEMVRRAHHEGPRLQSQPQPLERRRQQRLQLLLQLVAPDRAQLAVESQRDDSVDGGEQGAGEAMAFQETTMVKD